MLKKYPFQLLLWSLLLIQCRVPVHNQVHQNKARIMDERLAKIKMTDLDGHPVTLAHFAGKPVFINFWATWCGPCISEMKSVETAAQRFGNDIVFLAASSEPLELLQSFSQTHTYSFKLVHLDVSYLDVYVVALPTTFLVDRNGQLFSEEEGYRDWTNERIQNKLELLTKR